MTDAPALSAPPWGPAGPDPYGSPTSALAAKRITADQILNCYTAPIEIIPAVPGSLILPSAYLGFVTGGSTPYSIVEGRNVATYFGWGSGSLVADNGAVGDLLTTSPISIAATDVLSNFQSFNTGILNSSPVGLPLVLVGNAVNPTDGDLSLLVAVTYSIITIGGA